MIRLAALALAFTATAAQANCGPREAVIASLIVNSGMHRHAILPDAGGFAELYGEKGGRWVVLRTEGGIACIVAFGDGFQPVRDPLPGEAS